jgi:hypothetical protein
LNVDREKIDHGSARDRKSQSFNGITRAAVSCRQFKRSDKGEETWDEVCRYRLHPQGYEPERLDMPRDPTGWRVNDDDAWPPES